MRKFKNTLIAVLIIVNIICMVLIIRSNKKMTNENYMNDFSSFVKEVNESFSYEDYEEYLGEYSHTLSLPINGPDNTYIDRQKLFVYKSESMKTLIFLSLSQSEYKCDYNEWNSSYDYNSTLIEKMNKKSLPNVAIATYGINLKGCNINILAVSADNGTDVSVAAQEIVGFSNTFFEFAKNN